jgi:hypothetical protein
MHFWSYFTPCYIAVLNKLTMSLYIEHPITGEQIQVAKEDFPSEMNWDDAMEACEVLGNGWRLPIEQELQAMFMQLHSKGKGNFKCTWYWSSSQISLDSAWSVNFDDSNGAFVCWNLDKRLSGQVRAVRTMQLYIKHPITGDIIQVGENDFSNEMNWDQAMEACNVLGNGWRLPDVEELLVIYEELHTQGKGNLKDGCYWSSSQSNMFGALEVSFGDGKVNTINKCYTKHIRAVRSL